MTNQISELKSCPICGSSARIGNGFSPAESIMYVWCGNDDCLLSDVDIGFTPATWNHRAEISDQVGASLTGSREAFEAWCKTHGHNITRDDREDENLADGYMNLNTHCFWVGWQGSLASKAAAQPDETMTAYEQECQETMADGILYWKQKYEALLSQAAQVPEGWISSADRLPDIPQGTERQFIVAVKRAHNGKTYVFAANYLNAKLLLTDSDDCPEDGEPFSGWYTEKSEDGDYDTAWYPVLETGSGDRMTHWMPLPTAPQTKVEL